MRSTELDTIPTPDDLRNPLTPDDQTVYREIKEQILTELSTQYEELGQDEVTLSVPTGTSSIVVDTLERLFTAREWDFERYREVGATRIVLTKAGG